MTTRPILTAGASFCAVLLSACGGGATSSDQESKSAPSTSASDTAASGSTSDSAPSVSDSDGDDSLDPPCDAIDFSGVASAQPDVEFVLGESNGPMGGAQCEWYSTTGATFSRVTFSVTRPPSATASDALSIGSTERTTPGGITFYELQGPGQTTSPQYYIHNFEVFNADASAAVVFRYYADQGGTDAERIEAASRVFDSLDQQNLP